VFPDGTPLNDYLFNNEVYLYGYDNSNTLPMPISKMAIETISHKMEKKIVIDSIEYFDSYEIINSKENSIVSFGKSFTYNIDSSELNYKTRGNLKERLNDATFLNKLIEKNYFNIGNVKITNLKLPKSESDSIRNYLNYLNDILDLMKFFHINDELNMDIFNTKDYININSLIDIVLYNKKIKYPNQPGVTNVIIANINIAILITLDKNSIISIEDYYSKMFKNHRVYYISQIDQKTIVCSPYVLLKASDIIESSNLDLDVVEDSFKSIALNNDNSGAANTLILELIKVYDINNDFTNCLDTAINLCEWLQEYDSNSCIYIINKYQIIKRLRDLNKEEKRKLMEIRSASIENIPIQCGISILLENKSDFEYNFEKLPEEESNVFCEYPIYKLIK